MAVYHLQSNMDAEGEDIALGEIRDDPTYDDDSDFQTAETGFGGGTIDVAPAETPLTLTLQGQVRQTAIDDAYKSWGTPEGGINPDNFVYTEKDGLRLKKYPEIHLTNIRTKDGLAFSTIAGTRKGTAVIREELGFTDYVRKRTLNAATRLALQKDSDDLGIISTEAETVEMQDLGAIAKRASTIVETTFSDADAPEPSLPLAKFADLTKRCKPSVVSW